MLQCSGTRVINWVLSLPFTQEGQLKLGIWAWLIENGESEQASWYVTRELSGAMQDGLSIVGPMVRQIAEDTGITTRRAIELLSSLLASLIEGARI